MLMLHQSTGIHVAMILTCIQEVPSFNLTTVLTEKLFWVITLHSLAGGL
jgi:hypothetical protein